MGIIENGELAGKKFFEIFGEEKFPLLVKIIHARDVLSVQVHPCDEYARAKGAADTGKSELWYILTPPTHGELIIGLKEGVTREILAAAYESGTVEAYLNRIKVQRGDIINIPAGLIHALTPGTVVAEIQQNSDITYRLYDFNRLGADGKPRELHVADALACIDYENTFTKIEHFTAEKIKIAEKTKMISDEKNFSIYTCVEGNAIFETQTHTVFLPAPRSVFIPASLGEFSIRPEKNSALLLKSQPTKKLNAL
jgi:mannose-6-phosphate isomerase